jgi:hypothetical protein
VLSNSFNNNKERHLYWGGYLGEVIKRNISGEWNMSKQFDNAIALTYKENEIFPPAKVNKRIINGNEDNISIFYKVIKNDLIKNSR